MFRVIVYTMVLVGMLNGLATGDQRREDVIRHEEFRKKGDGEPVVIYEKTLQDGRVVVVENNVWSETRELKHNDIPIEIKNMYQRATMTIRDKDKGTEIIAWERQGVFLQSSAQGVMEVFDVVERNGRIAMVFAADGSTHVHIVKLDDTGAYETVYQESLYHRSGQFYTATAEIIWPELFRTGGVGDFFFMVGTPNGQESRVATVLFVMIARNDRTHIWRIDMDEKSAEMIYTGPVLFRSFF